MRDLNFRILVDTLYLNSVGRFIGHFTYRYDFLGLHTTF